MSNLNQHGSVADVGSYESRSYEGRSYEGHGLDELELRDYLEVLRRRWAIVVAVTLLCAAIAVLLAIRETSVYQASAEILLDLDSSSQLVNDDSNNVQSRARVLENEERVLNSRLIQSALEEQVGEDINASARNNDSTDTLVLTVTGEDPEAVAEAANIYAEIYLALRQERQASELDDIVTSLTGFIAEIDQQIVDLDPNDPSEQAELARLRDLRQTFDDERSTLRLTADVNQNTNDLVITPAEVPTRPISPKPLRNGVLATVVGLVLGVGLAMLIDYLDDTIKSKEDLESASGRLPTLALVPQDLHPEIDPIRRGLGDSLVAEAYRSLRTSVQFLAAQNQLRSLQVTSPEPGEGKTTTAVNLAVAMAQAGTEVIIVGADLRNPSLHRQLPISNDKGVATVLVGLDEVHEAVQSIADMPGLFVLPAGPTPPNPSELLSDVPSPGLRTTLGELVKLLADDGFFVIVDSAPVLPVTDALPTSRATDGTIIVASDQETHAKALARALEALGLLRTAVIGTVYNKVQNRQGVGGYRYRYGYGYSYGSSSAPAKPRGWRRFVPARFRGTPPSAPRPVAASASTGPESTIDLSRANGSPPAGGPRHGSAGNGQTQPGAPVHADAPTNGKAQDTTSIH